MREIITTIDFQLPIHAKISYAKKMARWESRNRVPLKTCLALLCFSSFIIFWSPAWSGSWSSPMLGIWVRCKRSVSGPNSFWQENSRFFVFSSKNAKQSEQAPRLFPFVSLELAADFNNNHNGHRGNRWRLHNWDMFRRVRKHGG